MSYLSQIFGDIQDLPDNKMRIFAQEFSRQMVEEMKKLIHFNTKDVGKLLSISTVTLQNIRLKGTKVGKRVKPTWADLEKFVEEHKAAYPALADAEYQEMKSLIKRRVKELRFMELEE